MLPSNDKPLLLVPELIDGLEEEVYKVVKIVKIILTQMLSEYKCFYISRLTLFYSLFE